MHRSWLPVLLPTPARNLSLFWKCRTCLVREAGVLRAVETQRAIAAQSVPGRKGRKRGQPGMLNSFEGGENGDNATVLQTLDCAA